MGGAWAYVMSYGEFLDGGHRRRNTLQYRDNADNSHHMQADGLTTILRCRAAVIPGVTNTLRLAIADTGDHIYDSWAFVQRDSFRSL